MHHPNEQILRELDDAQQRGDVEAFAGFFTEDVIAHVPGKSSLAGDYHGRDQFLEAFGRFNELVPEYSFESHAYLADDEHGVILQKSHYGRGEQTVDTNEAFIAHFRDGKVSEFWFLTEKSDEVDALLG